MKARHRGLQDKHPLTTLALQLWGDLGWRRRVRLDRESFVTGVIEGAELFTEAVLYEEANQ